MQRILVVEDADELRVLTQRLLEQAGYLTDGAGNGLEALELLERHGYSLVITDILMPEMEGLELIQACRPRYPDLRFIAVSGGEQRGVVHALPAAAELGAFETLAKPFSARDLLDAVERCIGQPIPAEL